MFAIRNHPKVNGKFAFLKKITHWFVDNSICSSGSSRKSTGSLGSIFCPKGPRYNTKSIHKRSILKASILFVYFLGYSNLTFIRIRKSCSSNYTVQILSDLGIQISKTICVKIRTFAWKFLSFCPWKIKINAWIFFPKCPWKCQSARENI